MSVSPAVARVEVRDKMLSVLLGLVNSKQRFNLDDLLKIARMYALLKDD